METKSVEELPVLRGLSESQVKQEVEDLPETVIVSTHEPAPSAESIEPLDSKPSVLTPFYVSASEYIQLREDKTMSELALIYEITTTDMTGEETGSPKNVILQIGSDYVSANRGNVQKIFDFKLNRFLEIKPQASMDNNANQRLIFDNVSLYAKAYRNMKTVLAATDNGKKRNVKIAEDKEIDAFWLESSMSWAARPLEKKPNYLVDGNSIEVEVNGETVFSATFGDTPFENPAFKNALFAHAHHSWPLHPSILLQTYKFDAPPERMEIVSYGPRYPEGQKQIWELKDRSFSETARFPLPSSSLSATERQPVSPLVFIINEAAHNRALGGAQTPEHIEADFETALKKENKLAQWLAGQKYIAYTGKCQSKDESWLCSAHADLTETNKFASISEFDPKNKMLSDFISAAEMAKDKKTRATALKTLQPYLDDPNVPAVILRTAAMARAGMKKASAASVGLDKIQADALLKRAIAADPYDAQTYLGLAQVYAAKGAYEQSWDIYDAMRVALPTVSTADLKIGIIEDKLRTNTAGYFLSD